MLVSPAQGRPIRAAAVGVDLGFLSSGRAGFNLGRRPRRVVNYGRSGETGMMTTRVNNAMGVITAPITGPYGIAARVNLNFPPAEHRTTLVDLILVIEHFGDVTYNALDSFSMTHLDDMLREHVMSGSLINDVPQGARLSLALAASEDIGRVEITSAELQVEFLSHKADMEDAGEGGAALPIEFLGEMLVGQSGNLAGYDEGNYGDWRGPGSDVMKTLNANSGSGVTILDTIPGGQHFGTQVAVVVEGFRGLAIPWVATDYRLSTADFHAFLAARVGQWLPTRVVAYDVLPDPMVGRMTINNDGSWRGYHVPNGWGTYEGDGKAVFNQIVTHISNSNWVVDTFNNLPNFGNYVEVTYSEEGNPGNVMPGSPVRLNWGSGNYSGWAAGSGAWVAGFLNSGAIITSIAWDVAGASGGQPRVFGPNPDPTRDPAADPFSDLGDIIPNPDFWPKPYV